jgi:hypothetical protein
MTAPVTAAPRAVEAVLAFARAYLPARLARALERVPADLVYSFAVIAAFALLGAIVAVAITLAGH